MSVSGIGSGNWSAYAAASADRTRGTATARADTGSSSDVDKVREKGLTAFAKEAKAEAMAEKVRRWREEAMKAMGLTQEKLDAMSPEDRAKAMQQIDEYVRRKIEEAMEAAREEAKHKGQPLGGTAVPQFVDFSA